MTYSHNIHDNKSMQGIYINRSTVGDPFPVGRYNTGERINIHTKYYITLQLTKFRTYTNSLLS